MVDHNILDKVLDKIKEIIDTKKFDDTKILIETDDKLPVDITLTNFVLLITCVIRELSDINSERLKNIKPNKSGLFEGTRIFKKNLYNINIHYNFMQLLNNLFKVC